MPHLPDRLKQLIDGNVIVHLATINADGTPQVTPVWIERDGDDLRIGSAEGRKKVRNLRRDPRLAISLVDPDDTTKFYSVQGHAVSVEQRGWDLIDRLAQRYWGTGKFHRIDGMVRVDIYVEVDRIFGQA